MLRTQDYSIGDLIKINDKYLAVITKVDKWSIESISFNYPHKENQIFVITEKFLSTIKKVIHE